MFGKKRPQKTIYGLIGLGRFGSALARELYESGADMIILDKCSEPRIDKIILRGKLLDSDKN